MNSTTSNEQDIIDLNEIKEFRELFCYFAEININEYNTNTSVIKDVNLYHIFQSIGLDISLEECETIIMRYSSPQHQTIPPSLNFMDFLTFYCHTYRDKSSHDEYKEAFRLLDDNDDGYIQVKHLKTALKGLLPNQLKQQAKVLNTA